MSNLIAIPMRDGSITALVTYKYPKPLSIHYDPVDNAYRVNCNGETELIYFKEDVLAWIEKKQIKISAVIQDVEFLMTEYKRRSIQITGREIQSIIQSISKVPAYEYATAEDIFNDCLPYDY